MAVGWDCVGFLLLALLDVPGIFCKSSILCPHTSYYHDCWIKRFPGLLLSLPGSEQRGAKVLQRQPERSAQLCSRKCCDQASCNLAVFYSNTSQGRVNCHLVHCPQPESCILQLQEKAVLFTVTAGIDPDLLVFDKVGHIDLNPRSFFKWERPNASQVQTTPGPLPTSQDTTPQHNSLSPEPFPHQARPPLQSSAQHSPPMPISPRDSLLLSHSSPPTAPLVSESTTVPPTVAKTLSQTATRESFFTSLPQIGRPMSDMQSPAHLDSSKQHLNETKGHSGKNQSSEGEVEDTTRPWVSLWLFPGLLGSSVTILCCCSGILALGCCRRRRGRYRPGQVIEKGRRTLIRCTMLKEKV
ncbi:MANSC domain-containing protein 4 [Discoglossus pictus]